MLTETKAIGTQIHDLMTRLYPICRSLTGDGVRETLSILSEQIPLTIHEVPSGTPAFDWTVPKEWNIHDAYIKDQSGERVVDFQQSNLHVVSYSIPVHQWMTLEELKPHLFTLPEHPNWIPHKTSYFKETWGFSLAHRTLLELEDGTYEVCIDSTLADGNLTYGELLLPGMTTDEVLISCHICHPSLCNDNLSGIAIATFLAEHLSRGSLHYSYRFLFIPATIGSIVWLSRNEHRVDRIKHGLVLTCLGDDGPFTYKRSRQGDAEIDRVCEHVVTQQPNSEILDFYPYGYDERQFCSPGFNLAVGVLMRSQHGSFPEYHTSADNLEFVQASALADSFSECQKIVSTLEANKTYLNTNPKCEPQLGKRGLYAQMGGRPVDAALLQRAILWVLNMSDGNHSLLDITESSNMEFSLIQHAAARLIRCGLLTME